MICYLNYFYSIVTPNSASKLRMTSSATSSTVTASLIRSSKVVTEPTLSSIPQGTISAK